MIISTNRRILLGGGTDKENRGSIKMQKEGKATKSGNQTAKEYFSKMIDNKSNKPPPHDQTSRPVAKKKKTKNGKVTNDVLELNTIDQKS